jgi:hypothetical protein
MINALNIRKKVINCFNFNTTINLIIIFLFKVVLNISRKLFPDGEIL